jgi:hypothetical protein
MKLQTQVAAVITLLFSIAAAASAAPVEIVAPTQKSTVHNNAGDMTVAVKVDPPLDQQEGTAIRILLDGKPAAPDAASLTFALTGVDRGQHFLQALLIDRQGRTLSVSDTVYFTLWQASIRNPPRRTN